MKRILFFFLFLLVLSTGQAIFFDDIGSTLYEVNVEINDSYIVLPMFLNEIQSIDSVAILSDGIIYYGKFN